MRTIDVRSTERGRWTILEIGGGVDVRTAVALREQVLATAARDEANVVVSLADVSFIDASGLAALMDGLNAARAHRGTLSLAAPSRAARRALDITGVDHVIDVHASVDDAMHDD